MARKNKRPRQQDAKGSEATKETAVADVAADLPSGSSWPRSVVWQLLIVAAGIIVGQSILYGPSLLGTKILLPLDHLSSPGVYIPLLDTPPKIPHNHGRADLIFVFEPLRYFTAEEMAAGRWAVWTPYQYAGSPMPYGKYSPMWVLRSCVRTPVVIAWFQLFVALSIGFGMYVFCRRVVGVGFWPAAIAAWCFPMTGFFILWEGYPLFWVAGWLPWLLVAVDQTVRRPASWGAPAVALLTYLVLADRQLDIAGQVLLASGIFAVWRLFDQYGWRWFAARWLDSPVKASSALIAGWALGFLLAAPCLLPTLEYARTGLRMSHRGSGREERPPIGLAALPHIVLPDMYGSTQGDSFPTFPKGLGSLLESSAAAYAGLVATLFVAPLAWCSRRHRSMVIFLAALAFFSVGWCLDVPGVVWLLRLPVLNMMSHNRLVFVASLAIIAMSAIGLEVLWPGRVSRRWWFWLPVGVLAILLCFCIYRTSNLPEPVATQLEASLIRTKSPKLAEDLAALATVRATFIRSYAVGGLLCALAILGWLILWLNPALPKWFRPLLTSLLVADLLWFAYGRSNQCDPSLYYPRIPALEEVRKSTPGRVMGYMCFPALLNHVCDLGDIRGDDGVDPARLVDLARIGAAACSPKVDYAATQLMSPKVISAPPKDYRLSPVLDMLNVRYVVHRGRPPATMHPDFSSPEYWILTNRFALPRPYVPERVETVADDKERLARLGDEHFDPRRVAYVEEPIDLPSACKGSAAIVEEIPTRIRMSVDMQTPGLVVLADLWDAGWHAYYNGNAVRILRTNHALRGVTVPAGKGELEFRYEPGSVAWGLRFCGLAMLVLLGWTAAIVWNSRGGTHSCRTIKEDEGQPANDAKT